MKPFKAMTIYRLLAPFTLNAEALHDRLAQHPVRRCDPHQAQSVGWTSPLGKLSTQLAQAANGCILVALKRYEKKIPTGALNEEVAEEVSRIEREEERTLGRRETLEIKERIVLKLLPTTPQTPTVDFAVIDPFAGYLLVNVASAKRADELVEKLREALGSLPVCPATTEHSPTFTMTRWLAGEPMGQFSLLGDCELHDTGEDGGVVRCSHQDLTSSEIRAHLDAGMQVVRLALSWDYRIAFTVDAGLALSKIEFSDIVLEEAADSEDEATAFDANFALMTGEFRNLLPALFDAFGGLETLEEAA